MNAMDWIRLVVLTTSLGLSRPNDRPGGPSRAGLRDNGRRAIS